MSKTNYKQTHSALCHSRDNTGNGDGPLGEKWLEEIAKACQGSLVLVALLSAPCALSSRWTIRLIEWLTTFGSIINKASKKLFF